MRVLNASDVKHCANRYEDAQERFNTIDENLIETRRLLHRDIQKSRLLSRLMKIPTYPMSEPVQWYAHKEPSWPRITRIIHICRVTRGYAALARPASPG